MGWSLLPVIAVLVFMKFFRPLNSLLADCGRDALAIIIPLGLSYYTLQTIGYVVDVYWGKVAAETNYLRLLLFVSFFPQVTQGPISDYGELSSQLGAEHMFTYENFSRGFQRMIWGYFKKLVIANIMAPYVSDLFANYRNYTGVTLFVGMFVVMVQLYADFSGYMDIVCGVCETLDIKLAENFDKPFFSESLAEFWRRWHITLGAWFKKYVFFTVGTSRLSKSISKKVGGDAGDRLISTVALFTIWFSIGIWHSVNLPFVLWGLANGVIMIVSVWLEDFYAKCREKLRIKDGSKCFVLFRMARTFALVSALEVFSDAGTLKDGCSYLARMIAKAAVLPSGFGALFPYCADKVDFLIVCGGLAVLFLSALTVRGRSLRERFLALPMPVRILIADIGLIIILTFGVIDPLSAGFEYAQF